MDIKIALDLVGTSTTEYFFPNLTLLLKGYSPGEVQLTFMHASVGNPFLGVTIIYISLVSIIYSLSACVVDVNT